MFPEDRINRYLDDIDALEAAALDTPYGGPAVPVEEVAHEKFYPGRMYGTEIPKMVADMGAGADWLELQRLAAPLHLAPVTVLRLGDDQYRIQFDWTPHDTYTKILSTEPFGSVDEALAITHWNLSNLKVREQDEGDPMNIFKTKLFPWMVGEMLAKPTDLTIKSAFEQRITSQRGEQSETIVKFVETDKGLILNKTNARRLVGMLGPDTDNWLGMKVTLYSERVQVGANFVQAVRVSPELPKQDSKKRGQSKAAEKEPAPADAPKSEIDTTDEAAVVQRLQELEKILNTLPQDDPSFGAFVDEYDELQNLAYESF